MCLFSYRCGREWEEYDREANEVSTSKGNGLSIDIVSSASLSQRCLSDGLGIGMYQLLGDVFVLLEIDQEGREMCIKPFIYRSLPGLR